MKRSDNIQNELQALGLERILQHPNEMPYTVPNGYFESLYQNIDGNINAEKMTNAEIPMSLTSSIGNVPDGYFEGFAKQILSKIKTEDTIIWTKEMPFDVPVGYFEGLAKSILASVNKNTTKSLPTRIPLYRTIQLAASLALVFFVGLGIFQANDHQLSLQKNFATISDAEIAQYINENLDDFDTDLVLNGLSFKNTKEKKASALNNISDEDINQFLIEDGMN